MGLIPPSRSNNSVSGEMYCDECGASKWIGDVNPIRHVNGCSYDPEGFRPVPRPKPKPKEPKIIPEEVRRAIPKSQWKRCKYCGTPMNPIYDPYGTATSGNNCCGR